MSGWEGRYWGGGNRDALPPASAGGEIFRVVSSDHEICNSELIISTHSFVSKIYKMV
jgi:hypothetical protein